MTWYYVLNNQQQGPVEQAELARLRQQSIINDATLIWREGMGDWQPYSVAIAPSVPPVVPAGGGIVCSECGQLFAPDQVIRLGSGYVCAGCQPIATQKLQEGVAVGTASEAIRQEHIKHEASVKSVGFLYLLGAVLLVLFGIGMIAAGVASTRDMGISAGVGLFLFFIGALQGWTGLGLRKLRPWARIPTGIFSGLGLLGFPLGTLINGYILYLVFSKKGSMVFSPEYQRVIAETPHIKYRTSIVVWILLGLLLLIIAIGFAAALFSGHRVNR